MTKKQLFLTLGLLVITFSVFSQSKLTPKQIAKRNYQEVIGDSIGFTDSIVPDKYAMYPNGMQGINNHMEINLFYPQSAFSKDVQGKVVLKFVVDTDGTLKEIEYIPGPDPALILEAVRALKKLKTWIPAYKDGQPMRSYYILPITFRIL